MHRMSLPLAVVATTAVLGMIDRASSAALVAAARQQARAYAGHADLPGVHLWYTDTGGSGAPIVFLHANTGTSESWAPQNAAFSQAGYRVIAFDRRGWGKSLPDPTTGSQPGTVADDLDGLAQTLKLDRFHLVGVAGGGFVALDYASWHPDRLLSLVLSASTGAVQEQEVSDFTARFQLPGFGTWAPDVKELSLSYRASNPDGAKAWLDLEAHAQQKGAPSQPLRSPNTYAKLESIRTPTLVMPADADLYAPPALMRLLAAHIRNSEWAIVPESGHSVSWEQPGTFNKNVLDFIGRHGTVR